MMVNGYAAEETRIAFQRVRELSGPHDPETYIGRYGEYLNLFLRGEMRRALDVAQQFLQGALADGVPAEAAVGHQMSGGALTFCGRFNEAEKELFAAEFAFDPKRAAETRLRFGIDSRTVAKGYLAIAFGARGQLAEAANCLIEATRYAEQTRHPPTVLLNALQCGMFSIVFEHNAQVRQKGELIVQLSQELGLPAYATVGRVLATRPQPGGDRDPANLPAARQAVEKCFEWNALLMGTWLLGEVAELEFAVGQSQAGLASLHRAVETGRETGVRIFESRFLRLLGDFLAASNVGASETAYREAMAVALEQNARTFSLQAAFPLARLLRSDGRFVEACKILAVALDGFTPTPELPVIADARALLAELAASPANHS